MKQHNMDFLSATLFPFSFGNPPNYFYHQKVEQTHVAVTNRVVLVLRELFHEVIEGHRVRSDIEKFALLACREQALGKLDLLVNRPSLEIPLEGTAIGRVVSRNELAALRFEGLVLGSEALLPCRFKPHPARRVAHEAREREHSLAVALINIAAKKHKGSFAKSANG